MPRKFLSVIVALNLLFEIGIVDGAGLDTEVLVLKASDAASWDNFGYSVAINSQIALIGAITDDLNGSDSGSAYIFNAKTGAELLKLTASDGARADRFGSAVAINGMTAIVGAFLNDEEDTSAGAAYLFDIDSFSPTFGNELLKITASDPNFADGFGTAVAIDDNQAVVSSPSKDDACPLESTCDSGAVYIFDVDRSSTNFGQQQLRLIASDPTRQDYFGDSVGISNGIAIVGAPSPLGTVDPGTGSACLFDVDPTSSTYGEQLLKLTANDAESLDTFGSSVAIHDGVAIVGSPGSAERAGAVYLFDVDPLSATFGDQAKLTAADSASFDLFGWSVAIDNGYSIVGARRDDDFGNDSGGVYVFNADPNSPDYGQQLSKLRAEGLAANDGFGFSVAISEGSVVVGTPFSDEEFLSTGSAFVFEIPEPSSYICAAIATLLVIMRRATFY